MSATLTTMRSPDTNTASTNTLPAERNAKKEKKQVDGQFSRQYTGTKSTEVYDFFRGEVPADRRGRYVPDGQLLFFDIGVKWADVIRFPIPVQKPVMKAEAYYDVEAVIRNNSGLVGYCLGRIGGVNSLNRDDVEQAGYMALWKAAEGFDSSRGVRFASYATPAISRAMIREVSASKDKNNPESLDALETESPSLYGSLATKESEAFAPENSEMIALMMEVADTLRSVKERKSVIALAMHLQGYSGIQISKAVDVKASSYTALICTGRKVVQGNPLFLKGAASLWGGTSRNCTVDLLGNFFTLQYAEKLTFDIPSKGAESYEAGLCRLLSSEKVADYLLNEVRVGEQACIINGDTGCTSILNVNEDTLELTLAVQTSRKSPRKSA